MPPISSLAIHNASASQPRFQTPTVEMRDAMHAKTKAKTNKIKPMFCIELPAVLTRTFHLDRAAGCDIRHAIAAADRIF
jgi:hypothetical protein